METHSALSADMPPPRLLGEEKTVSEMVQEQAGIRF